MTDSDLSLEPPKVPSSERADRIETLVHRRADGERRQAEAARVRRSLFAFAALWTLVPIVETVAAGALLPRLFVLHLGLVASWAVLVGVFADRRALSGWIDLGAGGVAVAAVLATLAGNRLDERDLLTSFDPIAVLPLVHLALFVRPRPIVAAGVAMAGLVVFAGVVLLGAAAPMHAVGLIVALAGATGLAVAAAQGFEAARHADRLARFRAEVAAHRLTHHADELRQLSEVDMLTGLSNRRSIDRRLPEIAEQSVLEDRVIGVMMIDVDHFKRFNDLWGHQAGDRCLVEVARVVGEQIRYGEALTGRFGGEEFLAVLPGAGLEATKQVAERLRAAVAGRLVATTAGNKRVTVSIGCAAGIVLPGQTIEDLLRAADQQLYAAKAAGRNRVAPASIEGAPGESVDRRVA